jgi:hypothetical protein
MAVRQTPFFTHGRQLGISRKSEYGECLQLP